MPLLDPVEQGGVRMRGRRCFHAAVSGHQRDTGVLRARNLPGGVVDDAVDAGVGHLTRAGMQTAGQVCDALVDIAPEMMLNHQYLHRVNSPASKHKAVAPLEVLHAGIPVTVAAGATDRDRRSRMTSATLITGANVWDGVSDQAAPRQVLVVDGRIQRVADAIEPPADACVIELPGHTLTPGFMDCHTHVTLTPRIGTEIPADSSVAHALKTLPVLRALLMNGFTTVRDLALSLIHI